MSADWYLTTNRVSPATASAIRIPASFSLSAIPCNVPGSLPPESLT